MPEAGPASPALDGRDASGADRFRALSEAAFEAIVLSEDGVIFDANPAAVALFGFEDVQDLQGRHAADLVAPEDADRVRAFVRHNHAEPYETVVVRADGRRVPVEVRGQPLAYRGRTARVTALRDITERKRVEEALRREKAFVQFLQEVAAAANEAATIEDVFQFALDRICAFTGWPVGHAYLTERREETVRLVPSGFWHVEPHERFERFRKVTEEATFGPGEGLPGRVLDTGQPAWVIDVTADPQFTRAGLVEHLGVRAGFAFPILVEDAVEAVLEFYAEAATPPDEALLEAMSHVGHQLGHVIDRKRVAGRLRASEERYRTLTQSAVVAIVTADAEGLILDWNRQAEHIFGYAREEILGRSVEVIMPRRHVEAHRAGMRRMREGGARHVIGSTVELHGVRQGGEEFPIELSLSEWKAGGRTFITAFIQDITERKRTEEALRRSEAQNRAILDALPDALTRLDADGTYLEVRLPQGYEPVRDPRELVGRRIDEVLPPALAERALRCIRTALDDDAVQTFEYEVEVQGAR
ncbi:MAG: PAS domain S-box protein, partial [Rhodothermales bacterium]|nr:PAS domain S-box protein [Rhodothermales bacterium]